MPSCRGRAIIIPERFECKTNIHLQMKFHILNLIQLWQHKNTYKIILIINIINIKDLYTRIYNNCTVEFFNKGHRYSDNCTVSEVNIVGDLY